MGYVLLDHILILEHTRYTLNRVCKAGTYFFFFFKILKMLITCLTVQFSVSLFQGVSERFFAFKELSIDGIHEVLTFSENIIQITNYFLPHTIKIL